MQAVVDDLKAKLLEEEGNTKKAGAAAEAAVPAATGKVKCKLMGFSRDWQLFT